MDTSCDDTSAAITQGSTIMANVVASQVNLHKPYGGVFPTIAKQAHAELLPATIATALRQAQVTWEQIELLAVTTGPGLAPALEVGLDFVLQLAQDHQKPLLPINHILGHIVSCLATPQRKTGRTLLKKIGQKTIDTSQSNKKYPAIVSPDKLPALAIVVSGGHTEFVLIDENLKLSILGSTIDDAAGECLDKIGRLLNLGYPAAPIVEQLAKKGDKNRFDFPLPMTNVANFNMSFSGLKTHSQRLIKRLIVEEKLDQKTINDFCASLQEGVFSHIIYKLEKLLDQIEIKELWLGGGVAANLILRAKLRSLARSQKLCFRAPYSSKLTGDNAAMIGVAGSYILARKPSFKAQKLDRRPSWPISQQ